MNRASKPCFILVIVSTIFILFSCSKEVEYNRDDEIRDIEEFMDHWGYNIIPRSSGLYFDEVVAGTGEPANEYDTVTVNYSGYFLTGIKFDAGDFEFVINSDYPSVIAGFNEAATYMNEGSEAIAIIPSWIAYGSRGSGIIPAYTPLFFELEMVKIDRGPLSEK